MYVEHFNRSGETKLFFILARFTGPADKVPSNAFCDNGRKQARIVVRSVCPPGTSVSVFFSRGLVLYHRGIDL